MVLELNRRKWQGGNIYNTSKIDDKCYFRNLIWKDTTIPLQWLIYRLKIDSVCYSIKVTFSNDINQRGGKGISVFDSHSPVTEPQAGAYM